MESSSVIPHLRVALGVFLCGGVGALARVLLASAIDRVGGAVLPHAGTLAVNLIGCLLFGFLGGLLEGTARVIVLGGLLGALTTYSTFAWLLVDLGRSGRHGTLLLQLVAHVGGGVLCIAAGLAIARLVAGESG
ncbi:MAG: chromosome condensation protein CrcB [Deltaproteobacteria bacterium]|nr:MAG: chromosome condensation protein CrcB [Deltaproteobacteria bacterium]